MAEDECAFYLNEAPRRAWGWKGERVISWRPGNIIEHYTLLLCIRNINGKGVIHWKLIEKGAKAVDFHDFIKEIYFLNDEKYYLLLDNASIHKAIKACLKKDRLPIRELFTQMNIDPLYLVPYTPQLNPVELCFNFLRKFVEEHEPRTYEELKWVIEKGIEELQEKDITKYFEHCLNYDFSKNEQYFAHCNKH